MKNQEHTVNCDVQPNRKINSSSYYTSVEENAKMGQVRLSKINGELYVNEKRVILYQYRSNTVDKQKEEVEDKITLNSCVLDYLLAHQELVPNKWIGKQVHFWGTIFKKFDGNLCVEFMHYSASTWDCGFYRSDINISKDAYEGYYFKPHEAAAVLDE